MFKSVCSSVISRCWWDSAGLQGGYILTNRVCRSLYQYMEIREWVCLKAMDANVGDSVHIWK